MVEHIVPNEVAGEYMLAFLGSYSYNNCLLGFLKLNLLDFSHKYNNTEYYLYLYFQRSEAWVVRLLHSAPFCDKNIY